MLDRTNFLVPNGTVVVEMIVFVLVMVVVTKYVVPHLRRVVEARQRRVETALNMAVQLEKEVADANGEADRIRSEARREARGILDGARKTHDYLIEKGRRDGREEYAWFTERAQREAKRRSEQSTHGAPLASELVTSGSGASNWPRH